MTRLLCALMLLLPINIFAKSALETMQESWQRYRLLDTEKEELKLTVIRQKGRERKYSLVRYTQYSQQQEDKIILFFRSPARDRGVGVLTWRKPKGSDAQWLYFPATKRIRRISASQQNQYFQGTDFTYEDIRQLVGERISDFEYLLIGEDNNQHIILAKPKKKTKTGYGQRKFWIRTSDYAVSRIDYFDKKQRLIKSQKNFEIKVKNNNLWRANKVEMENFDKKRKTLLEFSSRQINPELKDEVFTTRFLRKGK